MVDTCWQPLIKQTIMGCLCSITVPKGLDYVDNCMIKSYGSALTIFRTKTSHFYQPGVRQPTWIDPEVWAHVLQAVFPQQRQGDWLYQGKL